VNQLAANLTTQVRAIAEVATAVTKGDLTRLHYRRCARRSGGAKRQYQRDDQKPARYDAEEHEQDWLKTTSPNSAACCSQRDLTTVGRMVLSEYVPGSRTPQQAEFYILDNRTAAADTAAASPPKAGTDRKQLGLGQGVVGHGALEKAEDRADNVAARLPAAFHLDWAKRRRAVCSCCRSFSKPGKRRARACLVRGFTPVA